MPEPSAFIDYAAPRPVPKVPSPLFAMLLCLPGMVCWVIFLAAWLHLFRTGSQSPLYYQPELRSHLLLGCWVAALVTALTSLVLYFKSPKPWYVVINLFVNVAGLMLSILAVAAFFLILATWRD